METGEMSIKYNPETKGISVNIELANGTVWLTKTQIADIFNVYISAVTTNLSVILKEDAPLYHLCSKEIRSELSSPEVPIRTYYNLDIIIALAFRMKSGYCRLFRQWMAEQVKRSIMENHHSPIIIKIDNRSSVKN
jgi:hypothetical protein